MKLLENKIAVVTGGSRGIGQAIVEKFAEHGAQVAFTYVSSDEKAKALEEKISSTYGVKVKAYKSDAGNFEAAEALINDVLAEFGQVDILVNNAGISRDNLLLRVTPEQWNEVINANLNSVFYLTKQIIRPMMKAKSGSIINLSSIVGVQGNAGQASYSASKAGIIGFSKTVARELGSRNIRCNVIAPGFIATDMTGSLTGGQTDEWIKNVPLQRVGQGEDVANTALFLASDMSSYMTGQVLSVCGGLNI